MPKKDYLNRHEFHAELATCKRTKELSRKAIEMFTILSTEVSKKYFFKYEDDRQDAIASAIYDCYKYWMNFKESNVVQLTILRNFQKNETITLEIRNVGNFTYIAGEEFAIDETPNKTIFNLLNSIDKEIMGVFHDKVKCKVTFMDHVNGNDLSIKSKLTLSNINEDLPLISINSKRPTSNTFDFNEPPNGFSYFTSVVDKGILKSINKINPKHLRNGTMISLSHMNCNNSNSMFNL